MGGRGGSCGGRGWKSGGGSGSGCTCVGGSAAANAAPIVGIRGARCGRRRRQLESLYSYRRCRGQPGDHSMCLHMMYPDEGDGIALRERERLAHAHLQAEREPRPDGDSHRTQLFCENIRTSERLFHRGIDRLAVGLLCEPGYDAAPLLMHRRLRRQALTQHHPIAAHHRSARVVTRRFNPEHEPLVIRSRWTHRRGGCGGGVGCLDAWDRSGWECR